ncbi:DUF6228 family protein [Georgenia daeguensis]|uniref:Uncharacterized protein n=1 Tax=Georgenia daeguensis TaxID=908355 RepID=A0ABP8EY54_9MICO
MSGIPTVRIGSPTEHLLLTAKGYDGTPAVLIATLQLEGLTATTRVIGNYPIGFRDLAEFFEGLEKDWRGWHDTRSWESLEQNLTIEARHEYGHVRLTVIVRDDRSDWDNQGWRAIGDITLEPGEQLSQVARDVTALALG